MARESINNSTTKIEDRNDKRSMLGPEHWAIDKGKREMRRGSGTAALMAAIVLEHVLRGAG